MSYFEAGWNSFGNRSLSETRQTGRSWIYPGNSMRVYFIRFSFKTCFTTLCVVISVSAVPIEICKSRSRPGSVAETARGSLLGPRDA